MAKQIAPANAEKRVETVFVDSRGRIVARMDYLVTETEETRNGTTYMVERTLASNIVLPDGHVWNVAQGRGENAVLLCECAICKKNSRGDISLVPQANAVFCHDCGIRLCTKHRRCWGRQWRCPSCHRRHRFRRLLTWLFFEEA